MSKKKPESNAFVDAVTNSFEHCCGVSEVGGFVIEDEREYTEGYWLYGPAGRRWVERQSGGELVLSDDIDVGCSGTGLFVSTFIDSEACRAAYTALCATHFLLFQSPVKKNDSSGNKLFLCVFMHKDKAKGMKRALLKPVVAEGSIAPGEYQWPIQRRGEKLPKL
jgi:hypothetical protein